VVIIMFATFRNLIMTLI